MSSPDDKEHWMSPADDRRTGIWRWRDQRTRARERSLEEWWGRDRAAYEIEHRQAQPKAIGELMDEVLAQLDNRDRVLLSRLIEAWPEIVPAELVHQTRPQRVDGSTLVVEVFNAAVRYQMQSGLMPELLALVQQHAGDRITDLQLVPGGGSPRRRRRT
jgi:hypothetical protein